MAEVDEGLERAERTRPIPAHLNTQVRFLQENVARNDTKRLAEAAGVSGVHRAALRHTRFLMTSLPRSDRIGVSNCCLS
ncbi:hypothetical protein [Kitasatospora sp. NPDC058218]|uniref:hypothetical protein n=1 Tax=Kitasatospora sp. NPDC058218 TaxID=3346385 RepID=UPI0036D7AC8F